jgi:uncharacterized membrane protein (GlpM family)
MGELLFRFLVGGALVSVFALLGDLFRPKSFAGLFAAAPSVALATLALAAATRGSSYVALEARSMVVGCVALFVYATVVLRVLAGRIGRPSIVASLGLAVWIAAAAAGWKLALGGAT